jgi:hypothetical protein
VNNASCRLGAFRGAAFFQEHIEHNLAVDCRMASISAHPADPQVPVFANSAMIKPFPMRTLCRKGWNHKSLVTMASDLTKAVDLGRRAFEAEVSACRLREAIDARSQAHKDKVADAQADLKALVAIEAHTSASAAHMAAAVEPIRRFMAEAEKYMIRHPRTREICNLGDIIASVLVRVDTKRLEREHNRALPVDLPIKPWPEVVLPCVTGAWKGVANGAPPRVRQAIAPTRITWRNPLGVAQSGISKPSSSTPVPYASAVSIQPSSPLQRKKVHRGRCRGKGSRACHQPKDTASCS